MKLETGTQQRRWGHIGRMATVASLVLLITLTGLWVIACGSSTTSSAGEPAEGDIAVYQKILSGDPDNVEALTELGSSLMLAGRYDEALPVQEKVYLLNPDDTQTCIELAFNYLNHQQRAGDAVVALSQAVENEPSARNLTFLAQAQTKNGDLNTAENSLRRAIDTDTSYAYSYWILTRLLEDSGRTAEAAQVEALASGNGVDLSNLDANSG